MNIFEIMNTVAWTLSGLLAALILVDFIKVEFSRAKNGGEIDE